MASKSSDLHRIVVVGGGAGGLELVTRLGDELGRRKLADVTLIDKCRAHLWKPLLHEVAAGSVDLSVHEIDFLAQAHWHHFHYRIGESIGLDRGKREVHLAPHIDDEGNEVTPPRSFPYDTLVIAVGSQSNDFGTSGVREHAFSLDTPLQAKRFHSRLVNAYIRGHAQSTQLRPEQLHVAIIGAGATGAELAAELHYTTRQFVAYGLDRIDPEDIKIELIEAADRILPALPERLSIAATKLLESLGVSVRTSSKVAEVLGAGIRLATGAFIPAELVVWAAGVRAPEVLRTLDGLESNRIDQLVVLRRCRRRATRTSLRSAIAPLSVDWQGRPECSATCAGRAPAGLAHFQANQAPSGGSGANTVAISGFRFPRIARRIFHGRKPDGRPMGRSLSDRRPIRPASCTARFIRCTSTRCMVRRK